MNTLQKKATSCIDQADALLILAGAGIGVDSGLPDFRGKEGFWRSYPAIKKLGISFYDMANPKWFIKRPHLAWAFYGHRLNLYRGIVPHEGFSTLLEFITKRNLSYFVFTSNVDGQFQKAGFNSGKIYECHGSIHHLQCITPCKEMIWKNNLDVPIDNSTFTATLPLPHCPDCLHLARPNILMFDDFNWLFNRTSTQMDALNRWLINIEKKNMILRILEIGAGMAVPTVRNFSEEISKRFDISLIRINPRDYGVPKEDDIGIPLNAKEGLQNILINRP